LLELLEITPDAIDNTMMVFAGTEGEFLVNEPAAPLVEEAASVVEEAPKKDEARKPNRRRKLPC